MNFENQILFFFSALGAFNGLFLSFYFTFSIKNKSKITYFLAALLFVISVRVTKSVFFTFYQGTSSLFIQIGLTACFLIGPLLYFYTKATVKPDSLKGNNWLWHIIPILIFMTVVGILYPYREHWQLWRFITGGIFGVILLIQWSAYVFISMYLVRDTFKALFTKKDKLTNQKIWLLNVVIGNVLIWLFYHISYYTSYIVGAISFSFTLYLSLALWFFRKKKSSIFEPQVKYANKKIERSEAKQISEGLQLLIENERHKDATLKLKDVALELGISTHSLSQYLNDNLEKSFATFINEHRVHAAAKMLEINNLLTIEAIGNECGFRSNSTFYGAFKAIKGITPAQFKKSFS